MTLYLSAVAIVLYATAFSLLWRGIFAQRPCPRIWIALAATLAALTHGVSELMIMRVSGGFDFSLLKSISLVTAVINALTVIGSRHDKVQSLLLWTTPTAIVAILTATFIPQPTNATQLTAGVFTHVVLSIIAFALLSLAIVVAILVNFESNKIKKHQITPLIQHLPAVERLESFTFELIFVGTLLLTTSIVSGLIFVDDFLAQSLAHKTLLSVLATLLYWVVTIGHWHLGWRGRNALKWHVCAYALLFLSYAGSKFVLEWILHR